MYGEYILTVAQSTKINRNTDEIDLTNSVPSTDKDAQNYLFEMALISVKIYLVIFLVLGVFS